MSYNIALYHHERWDGKGYPKGLSGTDIPIEGRVVSLADVYDALTSRRPYKEPFPHEKAVAIVREGGESGQFDPEVTECFLEVVEKGVY
jgi:putative two-component system response regulator